MVDMVDMDLYICCSRLIWIDVAWQGNNLRYHMIGYLTMSIYRRKKDSAVWYEFQVIPICALFSSVWLISIVSVWIVINVASVTSGNFECSRRFGDGKQVNSIKGKRDTYTYHLFLVELYRNTDNC